MGDRKKEIERACQGRNSSGNRSKSNVDGGRREVFGDDFDKLFGASVVEGGPERRDVLGGERGHSGEETVGVWKKKRSRGLGL